MARRLLAGIQVRTETLATALFEGIDFKGNFLKQKLTRRLFAVEQYLPSSVMERASIRAWQEGRKSNAFTRARARMQELLTAYRRPPIPADQERALRTLVERLAREEGMDRLPQEEE